jgi:hypothetical protein
MLKIRLHFMRLKVTPTAFDEKYDYMSQTCRRRTMESFFVFRWLNCRSTKVVDLQPKIEMA